MSSSTQQYSPAEILAFGQRAEAEGKLQYAAQFYNHLQTYYASTPEGVHAGEGLARINQWQQSQGRNGAGAASQGGSIQASHSGPNGIDPDHAAPAFRQTSAPNPRPAPKTQYQEPAPVQPSVRNEARTGQHVGHALQTGPNQSGGPGRMQELRPEPVGMPRHVARAAAAQDYEDFDDYDDEDFVPHYRVGSWLASFFAFVGWIAVAGGLALAILGVVGIFPALTSVVVAGVPTGFVTGVVVTGGGLLLVFVSQIGHAVIDNANANRARLALARGKDD